MEEDKIKIVCPTCGGVLTIKNMPNLEKKTVTCPLCNTKNYVSNFKKINQGVQKEDKTEVPKDLISKYTREEGKTEILGAGQGRPNVVGALVHEATGTRYPLKIGVNIVGRQNSAGLCHISLVDPTKRISRQHLRIEVVQLPNGVINHYVSLAKQQVNETFINQTPIGCIDKILLENGQIITFPNGARFVFSIQEK